MSIRTSCDLQFRDLRLWKMNVEFRGAVGTREVVKAFGKWKILGQAWKRNQIILSAECGVSPLAPESEHRLRIARALWIPMARERMP